MTLYELNHKVAQTLANAFRDPVWVQAEISELRQASNGHCYMELIEKEEHSSQPKAKARAMIWGYRWYPLSEMFEQSTGQRLRNGLKVLVEVQVQMHEAYGYSLVIQNIDPSYTLGEMERRRREIIQKLTDEGMIDMNKTLPFPELPRRIAVISAESAAGFGDFCHQLNHNEWGVPFYIKLFPATMQGVQTEASVIRALDRIASYQELFDLVVIIRGGGAVADLASFDSYELGVNIANFPLPVITGIGHERDQTICDIVAYTSVKTPTAAAAMLIDIFGQHLSHIDDLERQMRYSLEGRMEREQMRISRLTNGIRGSHIMLQQQIGRLNLMGERIIMNTQARMKSASDQLGYMERTIHMAQPDNILKRGFSITRLNGKAIHHADEVPEGALLEIQTSEGSLEARACGRK